MALIRCKFCGKQISLTAEKCIHCGADVKDLNQNRKITDNNSSDNDPIQNKKTITDLTPDLENEFLKTNKEARHYKSIVESAAIWAKCGYILVGNIIVLMLLYLIFCLPIGKVHTFLISRKIFIRNRLFFTFTQKWFIFVFAISIVIVVLGLLVYKMRNTYHKKLIYHRMIQKWLLSEKNIIYKPIFASEKIKNEFDSIDLDISKL